MERERHVEEQQQREAHELGTRFDSVADKLKGERARKTQNTVRGTEAETRATEREGETEGVTAVITCRLEGNEQKGRGEEEQEREEQNKQSSLEEISKYRAEAQQKANDAISAAQERYQRAKQTPTATTQTAAMEKASQAKDVTIEKGQQGYAAAKDTLSSVAKGAANYTAPVAEKAKDYTVQAAEKAKSAGGTTAQYVGEKAVQAKDATVNTAADLKDKAAAAGWGAAHFSTDKTVEGTKAAASAVQGAAGYAGQKASELAVKSANTVKGLAAAAGETVKEYTSRKKEEAEREFEAKKAAQPQETEGRTSAKTTTESFQRGQGQDLEGGGEWRPGVVVGQTEVPHENKNNGGGSFQGVQERGIERNQGGVGETISPYAQKAKPTEGSQHQSGQAHGQDVTEGNVFATHKPHDNIAGRSFQGEQAGFGKHQARKGGDESMETIDKNVGNPAQREQHYSSENMAGFHGGREQLHGRRDDGVASKSLGQVQGEQGRKGTKEMEIIGGTVGNAAQREQTPMENTNIGKSFQGRNEVQGKGSEAVTITGGTVGNAAQREQKPMENTNIGKSFQGRNEVQGKGSEAVTITGGTVGNAAQREQKPMENTNIGKSFQGRNEVQGKGSEAVTIIGGTVGNTAQREQKPMENTNIGKGSEAVTSIGETLGDVAHRMVKKPLDNVTEGGGEMLGAVGETVVEIGENMMKPAQKVLHRKSQEGKGGGGGVLGAVGETISEIAETTQVFVAGEPEAEFRQSIGSDSTSRRV